MAEMNIVEAVNEAMRIEMERDESVMVLGEDVGKSGGVFRATEGLQEKFGEDGWVFSIQRSPRTRRPPMASSRSWKERSLCLSSRAILPTLQAFKKVM